MLLKEISLAGWRSFSPTLPAEIKGLGVVTLLIGPNNIGKSNVGRFLVRLRDILRSQGYHDIEVWRGDGYVFYMPLTLTFEAREVDHWLREEGDITSQISLNVEALDVPKGISENLIDKDTVRFDVRITKSGSQGRLSIVPLSKDSKPIIIADGTTYKLLLEDGTYTEQVTSTHLHRGLAVAACKCLAGSIIEIRPLRDPGRKRDDSNTRSTDGGDIIGALEIKQNDQNQQGFWTKCKTDLERWFSVLLSEHYLRIEINAGKFWVETKRGDHSLRCELADLGAGVSEILMVLAYLRLHPDQRCLVVIDEPEAHLHPGAVVELAKIITKNLSNHQLLVTTHSTSLIDSATSEWSAFRVKRANHHGTAFEELRTAEAELALLADLGLRPSQLFLSKVALWVEGPSDVHYWTALLQYVDPRLVAGRDYAFVMYGGASSSHLGFIVDDDEDEDQGVEKLVHVLKISHRAVIICDRDRNLDEEDRRLVARLVDAAKKLPQHARVETSIGREIENDVNEDVLIKAIKEVRPKRLGTKSNMVQLTYANYTIGTSDAFDEIVANAARDAAGNKLTKEQIEIVQQRLNQRKNKLAEKVRQLAATESKAAFRDEVIRKAENLVLWLLSDPI